MLLGKEYFKNIFNYSCWKISFFYSRYSHLEKVRSERTLYYNCPLRENVTNRNGNVNGHNKNMHESGTYMCENCGNIKYCMCNVKTHVITNHKEKGWK